MRFSLAAVRPREDSVGQARGKRRRRGPRSCFPDGSTFPGKGRLNFTATAIDTRLGTQQLRAEFDNASQQLLPGQFVRVQITAGARDNVFLVPQAAVMQTEKDFLVFVVDAENKATLRPVKVGDWVGANWTILSGLNAGDRVIVDNLLKVRPGARGDAERRRRVRRRAGGQSAPAPK